MGKGGKVNLNRNRKRSKEKGSDGSDDDYVLEEDEESNGSEELCVVSDDEEEEERFDFDAVGISSDEEVVKNKVVKSKSRTKPKPRNARIVGDPLDWRQSKKNSDDEDSEDEDDEEFVPDEEEEEEEEVVRSKVSKLRKKSLDRKRRTRVRQPSKRTRISDDEEEEEYCDFDDEDYEDGDEEFEPDEKETVGRKRILMSKDNSLDRKRARVRKLVKKTSISDNEEEYRELEDEDDDEEEAAPDGIDKKERVGLDRKRTRARQQPSKKTRVSDDDEEEYAFDEDDEEFAINGIDRKERVGLDRKRTRARQPSKKTRVSNDDDEEEYAFDEDDDDDDDDEFAPDGIDFVDEEEDMEVEKKSKKATHRVSRKKVLVRGRKRKRRAKVPKKPLKKKQRGGILGVGKSGSSDDEDFVDTVREKCRKRTRKRIKRMVADWESGSACSESSELEYTISEEEKESLEDAKKFCGEVKTSLRNSSPLKRSLVDGAPSCHKQQKPVARKGKAAISHLQNDMGKQVCGICLTEEGNGIVRGTLNCCSHYFCFACIMEWSKVESRCPLCKQRFVRITKTPRSDIGIDLRTSVIQVPTRDQVYRPSEEEVRGYYDPYENVVCMECHQGGDDSLMLLCDICDSSAHTYCVGLQREVPEGNWYCEGCRVSEAGGSSNMQVLRHPIIDHGSGNSTLPTSLSTTHRINSVDPIPSSSQYSVSIPEPSFSHHGFGNLQSPRHFVRDFHAPSPSGAGASTLSGRRRVHRQVHDRFSNNRENQMAFVAPRSTPALSHIDLNCEANIEFEQFEERTTSHPAVTLSISSNNGFSSTVEDWGQDIGPLSLSLSHSGQVGSQGTNAANTNVSVSAHATLHSEHERTNLFLGSDQFNYCSIRSDDNISPHTYREKSSFFNGASAK